MAKLKQTATSNVVLLARVDDPLAGVTRETRTYVQKVVHYPEDDPAQVVEMALEIAPDVKEWQRY